MLEVLTTRVFDQWLRKLKNPVAIAHIARRIDRVTRGGFGDAKSVGDGVSELRIDSGPGYRIYFARRGDVVVILLCGGDKSTQRRDIERAKALAKEV